MHGQRSLGQCGKWQAQFFRTNSADSCCVWILIEMLPPLKLLDRQEICFNDDSICYCFCFSNPLLAALCRKVSSMTESRPFIVKSRGANRTASTHDSNVHSKCTISQGLYYKILFGGYFQKTFRTLTEHLMQNLNVYKAQSDLKRFWDSNKP